MKSQPQQPDRLPDAIAQRLADADRAASVTSLRVDREIEQLARAHFGARRRPAPVFARRRWALPAAVAASAVLALLVLRPLYDNAPERAVLADDIDGSGRVDILDAFALARLRASGSSSISEGDIDRLAAEIVALNVPRSVL